MDEGPGVSDKFSKEDNWWVWSWDNKLGTKDQKV